MVPHPRTYFPVHVNSDTIPYSFLIAACSLLLGGSGSPDCESSQAAARPRGANLGQMMPPWKVSRNTNPSAEVPRSPKGSNRRSGIANREYIDTYRIC